MSNYDQTNSLAEQVKAKWEPILKHPELPTIEDAYKKNVTAVLLENQEQWCIQESSQNSSFGGNAGGQYNPGTGT